MQTRRVFRMLDQEPSSGSIQTAQEIVEESFASLPFPIEKETAIARIGDRPLPWDSSFTLGDVLRGVPAKEFRDPFHAARATDERLARFARALEAVNAVERTRRRRR